MNLKIKEIDTKLYPFEIFSIFKDTKDAVFLDSSKEDKKLSKYSFIGINPIEKIEILEDSKEDGFDLLNKKIKEYKLDIKSDIPFVGGFIGYISYDMGRKLEVIKDTSKEDFKIPLMRFNLYKNIIIFDLKLNKVYITDLYETEKDSNIEEIIKKINLFKPLKTLREKTIRNKNTEFISNFSKEEYIKAVKKMRNYIENGDIYIANMTQRYYCTSNKDSFALYEDLREINKAPFSAFINYEDFQIISSSPERFIKIKDNLVSTRPIKGTRPRGKNEKEDAKNKLELINSEKDKSELLMIVDLERNDLSKVCENNSVKVTELFKIEEYQTVFHLVSTIEGKLKKENTAVDCMRECFPGGSITGAPKIRAMEIIEELEGVKRNLYTGCIGYFDLRGNSDFNIAIRTILKRDNKAYFGVGGGVTYESNEEDEYIETLDKAVALMKVLK
ncbi:aminodeoxychorismate synthase component I [Clostridium sp. LY3-2]|uniref:aminodeoxychorismate synthase component I n=1 Tax=Clostridium sp. LY3-2 TaxID=2942482 RepID=UPI0021529A84|nr:aminodeoxychorismate synthase component I [Clostridium sp. LY3-2]MCR6515064.1 aminodeoxychorismate synthase component I [Clostridium sp. LY3-2]